MKTNRRKREVEFYYVRSLKQSLIWIKLKLMKMIIHPESERWLKQAREDLTSAEVNQREGRFYVAALLSQQAAEKGLKALIIEKTGEMPPKIHDLIELADWLTVDETIEELLIELDPAYQTSRYPDATVDQIPAEFYNQDRSKRLVEITQRIMQWINEQI